MGLAVSFGGEAALKGSTIALAVPLVSVAAQFPLWIVRQYFGWRLVRQDTEPTISIKSPLSIRDLMLATLIVAVSLGLGRFVPIDNGRWAILGFGFLVASSASSIGMLPAGLLLMWIRNLNRGIFFLVIYAMCLVIILWLGVGIARWRAPQILGPSFIYAGLSSTILTFAATVILAAIAARAEGYRLLCGYRQNSKATPSI